MQDKNSIFSTPFKSIFGFFSGKSSSPIFDDEIKVVYTDEMLSQSELQMLQRIVADAINLEEEYRKLDKMDAQSWAKGSAERDIFFKSVKKRSVKLKNLSALQYRLKHKIAAKG